MITVRTRHADLKLDNLEELRQAVRRGHVKPEDQVQLPDQHDWKKVADLAELRRSWWSRLNPWNVMVTLLSIKRQ